MSAFRNPARPDDTPPAGRRLLLATEKLCKDYLMGEVTVRALRDATVEMEEGEFVVILGPSGSGKSTILNLIGGIDKPTSGRILFDGRDLSSLGQAGLTRYRRESIGFVFQFYNLIPGLTARENVELACEIAPSPDDAAAVLAGLGMGDRLQHFPSQLSGGEQQRVAIARALAKNPRMLLCDEPTGALDYETGKQILVLLKDINEKRGKTVVVITHNAAIARIADRVIRLRSGEVVSTEVNASKLTPEDIEW